MSTAQFQACQIVLALIGCSAVVAQAQEDVTQIDFEFSADNRRWGCSNINTVFLGNLYVRVRVSKVGPTPVYGLSRIVFQPRIFSGPPIEQLLPWTDGGTGGDVPENNTLPAQLGRLIPFGSTPQTSRSASGALVGHLDSTWVLRIAGANATAPPPSDVAWGVNITQPPRSFADDTYNASSSVVVFKFGVRFPYGGTSDFHTEFSVPMSGIQPVNGVVGAYWFANPEGSSRIFVPVTAASNHSSTLYGNLGCACQCSPPLGPITDQRRPVGGALHLDPLPIQSCGPCPFGAEIEWFRDDVPISIGGRVDRDMYSQILTIHNLAPGDAGAYRAHYVFADSNTGQISLYCAADVDDGSGAGIPDGGVTIDDLLYYLDLFMNGASGADLDNGTGDAFPDGGVTIEDLLFYLARYASAC